MLKCRELKVVIAYEVEVRVPNGNEGNHDVKFLKNGEQVELQESYGTIVRQRLQALVR